MPTLMAAAQMTYSSAIQASLEAAGYGDVPRTGYRIVGMLTKGGSSVQELATRLAMSKQAVGRLSDVLVERGYLGREADPEDRRRVILVLTDEGRSATDVARRAIAGVDALLAAQVKNAELAGARAVLGALIALGRNPGALPAPTASARSLTRDVTPHTAAGLVLTISGRTSSIS